VGLPAMHASLTGSTEVNLTLSREEPSLRSTIRLRDASLTIPQIELDFE